MLKLKEDRLSVGDYIVKNKTVRGHLEYYGEEWNYFIPQRTDIPWRRK